MTFEIAGLVVAVTAYATSWTLAALICAHATRLHLIQSPNERSSHVNPTPSGGGIGIAIAGTAAGSIALAYTSSTFWLVLGSCAAAALLGLLDDRFDLSSRLRLAAHIILVGVVIAAVGTLPLPSTPLGPVPQFAVYLILLGAGVWWLNLFNFMDGIDGIASAEAIFVLLAPFTICLSAGAITVAEPLLWWAVALAAACGGFLMLNWPPARIFMGDAGSNYLALTILAIALLTVVNGLVDYPIWLILAATFVTDATVTLCRRILDRQRWLSAHRLHAYQKLSRRWNSHLLATMTYIAINLLWLYPLAYFAHFTPHFAWVAVLIAYLPLVVVAILLGAGKTEGTEMRASTP